MTDSRATNPWVLRGAFLAVLITGWVFVAWQNYFYISAPVVFVCLGYLAILTTVANLWRTGAAAVASDEQENDSTWAKPAGALGELEREKRTLLKAIKEAEFDHQMGKLSQHDVDDMIRGYRARAIEVIKEIDRLESGATGSRRDQIMREVRARLELEAKSQKKPEAKVDAKVDVKVDAKAEVTWEPKPDAKADAKPSEPEAEVDANAAGVEAAASDAELRAGSTSTAEPSGEASAEAQVAASEPKMKSDGTAKAAKADAKSKKRAAAKVDAKSAAALEDEGMDADSTTTVEPKRNDPAKEATP